MSAINRLAQNKAFSSLPPYELRTIETLGIKRKYSKGEFVTYQGDEWPYLLFVQTGEFQTVKGSKNGRGFVIENFVLERYGARRIVSRLHTHQGVETTTWFVSP